MKRKLVIYFSYAISVLFLYLTLEGIDYSELGKFLASFEFSTVLFASIVYISSFIFRGARLRLILDDGISFKGAMSSNLIAYALNNFMPLKGGDLYKIYFLHKHGGVRKAMSTAAVLIERLFDLAAVSLVFIVMIYYLNLDADTWKITGLINVIVVLLLLLAIGLYFVYRYKHINLEEYFSFTNPDSLKAFLECWKKMLKHRHFAAVLFLSVLIWAVEGFVFYIVLEYSSVSVALVWMSTLALSFVIPNAPGNIGLFEWVSIFVLSRLGFGEEQALSMGLIAHALQFVSVTVIGLGLYLLYKRKSKNTTATDIDVSSNKWT